MRREREDWDAGTTLVELLVTMIIVGILGTAVSLTVVSMTHSTSATKARDFATEQAQVTLDRSSRYLRAATPEGTGNPQTVFTYAGDLEATFYADLGQAAGPAKVDLSVTGPVSGATLVGSVTAADSPSSPPLYTYNGTPTVTREGSDINSAAGPVFTYYDASGNVLATPMTTVAQTSKIASVKVSVVDQESGPDSRPVSDSTLIYIRSVEYS